MSCKITKTMFKIAVVFRRVIYLLLFFTDWALLRRNQIIVFCYHSVAGDGWKYSVDPLQFKRQIDYLTRLYQPVSLEELVLYLKGEKEIKRPSFVLTFDDGYRDILQIKDYLKNLGIKPAIFILSDMNMVDRGELGTDKLLMAKKEIMELIEDGWNIGCHGARHINYFNLDNELIRKEIIESKIKLEKDLGMDVNYFAYPKGRYTKEILKAIEDAGYFLGLSMDDGFINRNINPLLIPRVGVDSTHQFLEFKAIFSPLSVSFRNIIKESPLKKVL